MVSPSKHSDLDDAIQAELGDFGKRPAVLPALAGEVGGKGAPALSAIQTKLRRAQNITKVLPTGYQSATEFPGETSGLHEVQVPIELIDDNKFNARRIYKPHRITKMAQSMKQRGQLQAGIAIKKGDRFMLVAGHYRKRGLKEAGIPMMRLTLLPEDTAEQELYLLSWLENEEREDQSPLDNALAWRDILDKKIWATDEALAISLGLSKGTISKTLALLELSDQARQQLEASETSPGMSVLYEYRMFEQAAKKCIPDQSKCVNECFVVMERILEESITRDELVTLRKNLEHPKQRKQKENSRQHKLKFHGKPIGVLKDWDDGRIVLDIKIADAGERAKLLDELRARYLPDA